MVEFAVCVFALALVLSALFAFGAIIPRTTRLQSEVRRAAGCAAQAGGGAPDGDLPPGLRANLPDALRPLPALERVTEERHETVALDALAAKYFFTVNGDNEFRIRETATLPAMGVPSVPIAATLDAGGLL